MKDQLSLEDTAKYTTALTGIIFKMKLQDLLNKYKTISLAGREDNAGLLAFFRTMTMETKSFSLRYDRGKDFFAFSREQSDRNFIFLIRDEAGLIKGCANLAVVPHFLNGKKTLCGYLGDLRISPALNARIRLQWKKFYSDLIEHFCDIEEFSGVEFLYSAILDENKSASRSLLKNDGQIIYRPLSTYETFNVVKPLPQAAFIKKKFTACRISMVEAREFLCKESQTAGLQNFFRQNDCELSRRIRSWENFENPDFLAVKNDDGKIIAVCAPKEFKSKKLVVESMSKRQKFVSLFLPLFRIPRLREKMPIRTLYLTHLTFNSALEKREIALVLNSFLLKLFKEEKNMHSISFFTWPQWELKGMPFYIEKTGATFYQVMNRKQFEEKQFLNLNNNPPAFEIGIA